MPESEDFVLGKWVREQLEKGDDPEVLKATLKNRGLDADIVDPVLSSLKKNPMHKIEQDKKAPKKKFCNYALKREVDKMLSSKEIAEPALPSENAQEEKAVRGEKETASGKAPISALEAKPEKRRRREDNGSNKIPADEKSLFSLFAARISESMPRIKIRFPKLSSLVFNDRLVITLGILGAVLIIALLISFGLDWYADRMAKSIFG